MTEVTWWAAAAGIWVAWLTRPRPRPRRPSDARSIPSAAMSSSGVVWRARWRVRRVRRSRADRPEQLAAWCADVARRLRAGDSVATAATGAPTPDDERLADAVEQIGRGEPPGRIAGVDRDLALVLGVLTAVVVQGGPAAEPLDRVAAVLRARAALAAEAHTQSAQARWSAQVMTALPGGMLAVLLATSSSVRTVVVRPVGATVVALGVLLNLAGWWWLRRLLARPTS